jgi:hypothetical protein
MTKCPSCGAEIKDGDWTCGGCGAPVAGAGMAPAAGEYGGGAPAEQYGGGAPAEQYGGAFTATGQYGGAATAAAPSTAPSGLLKTVLVFAVIAVVAVVLVWFFLLRGPATTGEEFVGTWTATTEQGIATIGVAKEADAFTVTLTGNDARQKVTVPAHLDGEELLITVDDFSQMAGEENAAAFKAVLVALAADFKLIFSSVDATHLDLRIVGTAADGQDFDQTTALTKDVAPAP